jgi:hypothetical protein
MNQEKLLVIGDSPPQSLSAFETSVDVTIDFFRKKKEVLQVFVFRMAMRENMQE